MAVMCPNKELTDDIDELKGYVLEELNVRLLTCTQVRSTETETETGTETETETGCAVPIWG